MDQFQHWDMTNYWGISNIPIYEDPETSVEKFKCEETKHNYILKIKHRKFKELGLFQKIKALFNSNYAPKDTLVKKDFICETCGDKTSSIEKITEREYLELFF